MIPVVCTGRGTHAETPLKMGWRYHEWERDRGGIPYVAGGPPTVPGDSPSGRVPACEYEHVFVCRICRPRRRVALSAEQYRKLDDGVLPALDISYMD